MLEAARIGDEITHTSMLGGLVAGMLLGALAGAAILATVVTGGLAAAPALMIIGAVCTGAAVGGSIGQLVGSLFKSPRGVITTGAATVFIGGLARAAARACVDTALCQDHGVEKIATGSATVYIEQFPAARVDDLGQYSFEISKGATNVFIGGEKAGCPGLEIEGEVPKWLQWLHRGLGWVGALCLIGPAYGLVRAIASVVGGEIGAHFGGQIGEKLGGRWGGVIGSVVGGFIGGGIGFKAGGVLQRLEVRTVGLGSNFGNVRIGLRPQPPSPYFIRYDPRHPGRPDPRWSIDSRTFTAGETTANGGIRNNQQFWEAWMQQRPETISRSNAFLIREKGLSPRVDQTWINSFPEQAPYARETLIHHHVDQGPYAIPVPSSTHVGSGGPFHGFPLNP